MLTVALGIIIAANVSLVVLLAAMWTARSPRHPQHADFLELAGLLRGHTGAKGGAWTRARSVLAVQSCRSPWWSQGLENMLGRLRQGRQGREPLLCIHCSDFQPVNRGLTKAHSWPPGREVPKAGDSLELEPPPLSYSSTPDVAILHGLAQQSALQPRDVGGVPHAVLPSDSECRTALRALYKQQFTCTAAGDLPQDTRTPPAANSMPEEAAPRQEEPAPSPFMFRAATNCQSPSVAPFPSASSCPVSIPGDLSGQGLGSKPTRSFDTVFDALLETSVSTLLGASQAGALIGTRLARGYSTDSNGSIQQQLDMLPV